MIYLFVIVAILIGMLMPIQSAINAVLTFELKRPFLAAMLSLSLGAFLMAMLALSQGELRDFGRLKNISPHLYLGGIMGALFVSSSLYFIPRMGATTMITCFVTGQMMGSLLLDHFGLFGLVVRPLNIEKLIGITFLLVGILLVMRKNT